MLETGLNQDGCKHATVSLSYSGAQPDERHTKRPLGKPAPGELIAVFIVALVVAGGAFAYFTSTGSGTGSAGVGMVNAPTNVSQRQATTRPPAAPPQ